MLSENARMWFKLLIDNEIEDEKGTIENEKLWAKGSSSEEEYAMHIGNMKEHVDYLEFLNNFKSVFENVSGEGE